MSRKVLIYRWIVFLLAAGYCLRTIILSDYDQFAGPFRFLTIWALFASFFCASRMLALAEGRSTRRWDGVVGMTAVVNLMVVYLYWSLFLDNPASVTQDGELGQLYLELYLHGLGPLLQWIDALFIHRAFQRFRRSLACLVALIATYVVWIELAVQTLATRPRGTVTHGLPYPFLNNLVPGDRAQVYATYFVAAAVLLVVFTGLGWLIARWFPQPKAVAALSDNPGTAA